MLWALAMLTAACSGRAAPERAGPERSAVAGGETDGKRGADQGAPGGGESSPADDTQSTETSAGGAGQGGGVEGGQGPGGQGDGSGAAPRGRQPGWRPIAPAPIRGRHAHSAVWTGEEMIVWGGAWRAGNAPIYLDDGAAYDPAADRWRRLPPARLAPRADHLAAWTGTEMLIWGGHPGTETPFGDNEFVDGAAYDPAADRWRPLAAYPLGPRYGGRAVWTGRLLVVWGGARAQEGEDPPALSDGAAYDPVADRWTRLPASPLAGRKVPLAAPTRNGVLLSWGFGSGNRAVGDSAVYDPASQKWTPAAPAPPTESAWCFDLAGCVGVDTGRRVVFAGEGLAYDPEADRWSRIAESPFANPFLDGKAVAWTGERVVVWGGGTYEGEVDSYPATVAADPAGLAYDPRADRWEPVGDAPIAPRARARGVWTGAEVIVWGGESTYLHRVQYADGAAWAPD